jgi:pilus assembly protein Flp/PilA
MLPYVMSWLPRFNLDTEEEGQGLVEYALIIVLVSIVCMAALRLLGVGIGQVFTDITTKLGER